MINKSAIMIIFLLINIIPSVYSSNQERISVKVFVSEKTPYTIEMLNTQSDKLEGIETLKECSLVMKTINKIKKFILIQNTSQINCIK